MARYTGPMTKKSRRLGTDLVGNDKAFERRPYPPGVHGRGRTKDSEYSLQLKEKQKARFAYGVLEKQFRRYYEEADRHPGKTGDTLLQILKSHLDRQRYDYRYRWRLLTPKCSAGKHYPNFIRRLPDTGSQLDGSSAEHRSERRQ